MNETLISPELWFESTNENRLSVNGKQKALSDRNLNQLINAKDEAFVFSPEFVKRLKEEFSNENENVKGNFNFKLLIEN